MQGFLRHLPIRSATLLAWGVIVHAGPAEHSVRGSILYTDGGTDAVDEPLVIPRFAEAEAAVRLDGKLDDAIWAQVPAYDRMTLIRPDKGGTGRYRTQTFIFHTERGLYFGAWNEQPADSLTTRLAGRDAWGTGDAYQVMIDSSGNGRYGYWFMVTLGGTLADGHLMPERRFSDNWDGPWRGETRKTETGWTVEMFLPWSMLDMPAMPDGQRQMGLLVTRDLAAIHERWAWPGLSWTQPKFISAFQPIMFEDVAPRQEISIFPYATHLSDFHRQEHEQKVGLDVFWRPSTALLVNAAVNPDFGQVEADDIIVNLSAYETFFDEKRLFFAESQEVFEGSIGGTSLLHTRRIGSSVGSRHGGPDFEPEVYFDGHDLGKPVDLLFAAKAVGQLRNWRWGALGATEADTELALAGAFDHGSVDAAGRNFGVMRWQRETTDGGGRRAVGWMGTLVDHPERRAITHGVDAHYSTPDAVWTWDGQLFLSDVENTGGLGAIGQLQLAPRRGDVHFFRASVFDDELDLNDAGYLWRNDFEGLSYEFTRRNQDLEQLRELRTQVALFADFNGAGQHIGSSIRSSLTWAFLDNTQAFLFARHNPEHWDDRNSRGHGAYRVGGTSAVQASWFSDVSKPFHASFSSTLFTESEGGWGLDGTLFLTWRPVDRITLSASLFHENRDGWLLWQGGRDLEAFESRQWSPQLRFDAFFTARQQLRIQVEWTGIKASGARRYRIDANGNLVPADGNTSEFAISRTTTQLRYRWQIAPLSDLFVVYNRGGSLPGASTSSGFLELFSDAFGEPQREALLVKIRYRFGR